LVCIRLQHDAEIVETRHRADHVDCVRRDRTDGAGKKVGSGVYFYRVDSPDGTITGRLTILK